MTPITIFTRGGRLGPHLYLCHHPPQSLCIFTSLSGIESMKLSTTLYWDFPHFNAPPVQRRRRYPVVCKPLASNVGAWSRRPDEAGRRSSFNSPTPASLERMNFRAARAYLIILFIAVRHFWLSQFVFQVSFIIILQPLHDAF